MLGKINSLLSNVVGCFDILESKQINLYSDKDIGKRIKWDIDGRANLVTIEHRKDGNVTITYTISILKWDKDMDVMIMCNDSITGGFHFNKRIRGGSVKDARYVVMSVLKNNINKKEFKVDI